MRIVFIGVPNVGKSSIFNLFINQYKSRVENTAGTTTDWREAKTKFGWIAIDTPGIESLSLPNWWSNFKNDLCVFIGDASRPLSVIEKNILRNLPSSNCILCLNKSDLSIIQRKDFLYISSKSKIGISALISMIQEKILFTTDLKPAQCMFIGRPNSGKSSIINKIIGYDRVKVSPIEGTTSDVIYIDIGHIQVLDTPGEHRKGIKYITDRLSCFMGVVFLVLDSTEDLVSQDLRCINAAWNNGCPVVILLNKYDLAPYDINKFWVQEIKKLIPDTEILRISAKTGKSIKSIYPAFKRLSRNMNSRIPTSVLNNWIRNLELPNGLRIKYISQVSINPIKLHFNYEKMERNFIKFICSKFRKDFKLGCIPILVGSKFY